MTTRVVSTGIDGLDLALGGGLRLLERLPDRGECATVLVRGSAGTGKSLMAIHLAAALATDPQRASDIAYACIELLPLELAAEVAAFKRTRQFSEVVTQPFEAFSPNQDPCRLFAATIDPLAGHGDVTDRDVNTPPGYGLLDFLHDVEACGGRPRILVIDSLSDGYRMGQHVDRRLADAVSKLAVDRGMVAILVEESTTSEPSPWCFSVDTVIELALNTLRNGGLPWGRSLVVSKHRFGRCEPGPHQLSLEQAADGLGVMEVLPAPETWLKAVEVARHLLPSETVGPPIYTGWSGDIGHLGPGAVIYIAGPGLWNPLEWALSCFPSRDTAGVDVLVTLSTDIDAERQRLTDARLVHWSITDPWTTPNELASGVVNRCRGLARIHRIILGDLAHLKEFAQSEALRRTLVATCNVLTATVRAPVIVFETTPDTVDDWHYYHPGANVLVTARANVTLQRYEALARIPSRGLEVVVGRKPFGTVG